MATQTIINSDCIVGMQGVMDETVDLIVTSPPYNVGIQYSHWNDEQQFADYMLWVSEWLRECYRILKPAGRIAVNVPVECNMKGRGGRVYMLAEYNAVMLKLGFNFAGCVDLRETSAQIAKRTAWGSWLSPSAPYINNPKEGILLMYKDEWKRENPLGMKSWFEQNGDAGKKEFMRLVAGQWEYRPETRKITEANYSESLPEDVLKILTYEEDLVVDPFSGSGTTAVVCKRMGRNFIGFEISPEYYQISLDRLNTGVVVNRRKKK